jgi:hypothetical protein
VDLLIKTFLAVASKWGPWAALALLLVAVLLLRFDQRLDAQAVLLGQHVNATDRQVRLLEIMCVAVVETETERKACGIAAGK